MQKLGDDKNNSSTFNWFPKNNSDVFIKMSSIGPMNYNGHVIIDSIFTLLNDFRNTLKIIREEMDNMFPAGQSPRDNKLHRARCSSTFMTATVAIAFFWFAFKGVLPCRGFLLDSKESQQHALKNDIEGITQLFNSIEMSKVKKRVSKDWFISVLILQ